MRNLIHKEYWSFEVTVQAAVYVDAVTCLLLVEEEAGEVEVLCPVVSQLVEHLWSSIFLTCEGCELKPCRPKKRHFVQGLDENYSSIILASFLLKQHAQHIEIYRIQLPSIPKLSELTLNDLHLFICWSISLLRRTLNFIPTLHTSLLIFLLTDKVGCIDPEIKRRLTVRRLQDVCTLPIFLEVEQSACQVKFICSFGRTFKKCFVEISRIQVDFVQFVREDLITHCLVFLFASDLWLNLDCDQQLAEPFWSLTESIRWAIGHVKS